MNLQACPFREVVGAAIFPFQGFRLFPGAIFIAIYKANVEITLVIGVGVPISGIEESVVVGVDVGR